MVARHRARVLAIGSCLVLVVGSGCGGGQAARSDGSTAERVDQRLSATGAVAITGSTPFEQVMLRREGQETEWLELRGDYRPELRRLSGARIRVSGTVLREGIIEVEDYEILEIAGQRPEVGILTVAESGVTLRTSEGSVLDMRRVPEELRELPGAKVWVILDEEGAVQGYGVLRKP